MNLVIDSSIYFEDQSLSNINFAQIKNLGRLKLLNVHVPWMIYQECTTKAAGEIQTDIDKALALLNGTLQKGVAMDEGELILDIAQRINTIRNRVIASNNDVWWRYLNDANAKLYEFNSDESSHVFKGYFAGTAPFQKLKSREDIPDAFIFEFVKTLATTNSVVFLTKDNKLASAIENIENVTVFKKFKDFFESEAVKELIIRVPERMEESQAFKSYIIGELDSFKNAVENFFINAKILTMEDESIPSDFHDADVVAVYERNVGILEDEIRLINGQWYVPIVVEALADITYSLWKDDYYRMREDERPNLLGEQNKHYFLVADLQEIVMKTEVIIDPQDQEIGADLGVVIDHFDSIKLKYPVF